MAPTEPRSGEHRDNDDRSWREESSGGSAQNSPDDYEVPYNDQSSKDEWRTKRGGPHASPDDFSAPENDQSDGEASATNGTSAHQASDVHSALEERLGQAYEVIFEAEGYQIRRAEDRAFIAEYIPTEGILRSAPHVLLSDHEEEEDLEALAEEGRRQLSKQIDEWEEFGFQSTEEGHVMSMPNPSPGAYKARVPRYIQPMAKQIDSLDDVVDSVEWVRSHRHLD